MRNSQRARATRQRHRAGDDQRHRRRQELPPGSDDLRRVPARSTSRPIRSTCAPGFVFSGIFPVLRHRRGPGHRRRRLLRRAEGAATATSRPGDWYLFVQSISPLLVPADQHRLVLEPVPAGAVGQRARLRADRRRAARGPDRQPAGAAACDGRIEFRDLTFGYNDRADGAAEGFNLTIPAGRDGGVGRAHRRGQVDAWASWWRASTSSRAASC